jgi:uncharacterized protein
MLSLQGAIGDGEIAVTVFLDTAPLIYFVENPQVWGPKAIQRIGALRASGDRFAVTESVRMECLVVPYRAGSMTRLADFAAFFSAPDLHIVPISTAVAERAAKIRATHNLKPLDPLHLAAAVEHGCGLFLSNDIRLSAFPDIPVEVLT